MNDTPETPKKFRAKQDAAIKAVEAARTSVELGRKRLEIAKADKKEWFQLQLESREAKLIEAEGALANLNLIIEDVAKALSAKVAAEHTLEDKLAEYFGGAEPYIEMIRKYGSPIYYREKTQTPNEAFWGATLLRNRQILYSPAHADWYDYNSKTGCWFPITEDKLSSELHSMFLEVDRKIEAKEMLERQSTVSFRRAVIQSQRGFREDRHAFLDRYAKYMHVANGVIEFNGDTPELHPFDPKYKSLNASPIAFDPKAECPQFLNLIAHLTEDDRGALQRIVGQFLLGRNMTQKIFLFEGEGNSGKSTLAEIIGAIVGEQNCTELRTQHLDNRFEMYRFLHRSLLVGSDVDYDFLLTDGAAQLKKLTGGDLISAEKKRANEAFEFRGDFNILVTTNSKLVLRLSSDAAAWKRRLVLIDFPASGRDPSQNKPEYAKQLIKAEGSGILNWAVEGAAKLIADFKEGRSFSLTAIQESRITDRINESDSLCTFLRDSIEGKVKSELATQDIIRHYSDYCRSRGWGFQNEESINRRLGTVMNNLFGAQTSKHVRNQFGQDHRGYTGVGWKSEPQAKTETQAKVLDFLKSKVA